MNKKLKNKLLAILILAPGFNLFNDIRANAENISSLSNKISLVDTNKSSVNSSYDYSNLRKKLDDFIYNNQELKSALIGVKLNSLSGNQEVYSLNADKLFVPASNMKIFTTLLALEKLGQDYTFNTFVSTDGTIENGELKGNIYLNFVGDPTFTSQTLKKLLLEIKKSGVNKLTGNIIINRNIFDNTFYGPGWMWDDMDSCDDSPIDALYIDDNCIKVSVISSQNKIYTHTDNLIDVNTSDIQISKDKESNLKVEKFENNTLKISGKIPDGKTEELEQSIINPDLYLNHMLKNILKNYFDFQGEIKLSDKPLPKNLNVVAMNVSQPLAEILKRFDKESHNLTGELLIKTIALNENKSQGSTEKGIDIMKKYLTNTFSYKDFNIVDGSGLSRYNLLSPSLIISALNYMYDHENFKNLVLNSFPIGGQDGTLKNRLKKLVNYKVIAKSGSMTGVNCLSGYLIGENGNNYSFSIMINNTNLSGKALRDIQDKIIYIITGA